MDKNPGAGDSKGSSWLRRLFACKTYAKPVAEETVLNEEVSQISLVSKEWKKQGGYFALALSGGGIRSATFNLGVLQALAERKLLTRLDYLSTVSGGGYIGSWFSALVERTRKAGNLSNLEAVQQVQSALDPH